MDGEAELRAQERRMELGPNPGSVRPPDVDPIPPGFENVVPNDSPEGRAERTGWSGMNLMWVSALACVLVVIAAAIVAIFDWGVALVVLGFGLALAIGGNPEIWVTPLRAREREEEIGEHEAERAIEEQKRTGPTKAFQDGGSDQRVVESRQFEDGGGARFRGRAGGQREK